MRFRTEIELSPSKFRINYSHPVTLIGSCFTQNIGNVLQRLNFRTDINPFGVIYNPLSVKRSLDILMEGKKYKSTDLNYYNEKFFSWDHHSDFSGSDKERVLKNINEKIEFSRNFLKKAHYLFISWGTAWIYSLKSGKRIVSNCHKVPAGEFDRKLLEIHEIVGEYKALIESLKKMNPELKIIFTVSPVRHWKDGAHGNQISKSVLLLSIDKLLESYQEDCDYFPSYEILLDDLRDYRFYENDLVHPSRQAIDYIWEKFTDRYIDPETSKYIIRMEKLVKASEHRITDRKSQSSVEFLKKQNHNLQQLKNELPFLDWANLEEAFRINILG